MSILLPNAYCWLLGCALNTADNSTVKLENSLADREKIERAVRNYIESQHEVDADLMAISLDRKLAKRTYWKSKDDVEYVMETDYKTMLMVAETYNKKGDKFPDSPRVEVRILDIDNRVSSVKLTADDWIDYMHLYKNEREEWKIINVLWQYHNAKKHSSQK